MIPTEQEFCRMNEAMGGMKLLLDNHFSSLLERMSVK